MLLYNLIHSLNSDEKSYFVKTFSSSDNSYAQLFRIIANQKKYDEKLIKKQFEQYNSKNSYAYFKNYLYHAILRASTQNGTNKKNIYYYLSSIQFLTEKGLYVNSLKLLKTAYKEAMSKNDYLALLKLVEVSKRLKYMGLSDNVIDELINKQKDLVKRYEVSNTFTDLRNRTVFLFESIGSLETEQGQKEFKAIRNYPYLKSANMCIDENCEVLFYSILFWLNARLNDEVVLEKCAKELERILNDSSYDKALNSYTKKMIFFVLIYDKKRKQQWKKTENLLELYLKNNKLSTANKLVLNTSNIMWGLNIQINILLLQNKIKEALYVSKKAKTFIKSKSNVLKPRFIVTAKMNEIVIDFYLKNYKKLLTKTNQLLINWKHLLRQDMIIGLYITELIGALELKNINLVESRWNSFKYYLKSFNASQKELQLFNTFFSEIINDIDIPQSVMKLLKGLESLENYNKTLDELKHIRDWAEEKKNSKFQAHTQNT